MRRVGLAVLVAGITGAGCTGFRDVFTSHAETAARVGSRELKSERVAEIIGKLGGPNANPQAAELVTGIWVDMSLFGDRVAAGTMKADSALLERLMWPQIAEQKVSAWHDSVLARRGGITPDMADSMFNRGDQRLFQHILFSPAGPSASDTARARSSADRVRSQANARNFGALAAQHSTDGSKNDGGYLMVAPRGAFVKEFDDAAWALSPGQVSDVVKSQFGFHIIRRPTIAESRERFLAKVKEVNTAQQDSLYMQELTNRVGLVVKPGTGEAVKSAVADLPAARKSRKELVTSRAGAFTVADLVRWIDALPPAAVGSIRQAEDSLLATFVKTLAQNAILLKEADSAGITVNPTIYEALTLQYKTQVGNLREGMGLDVAELSDSSKLSAAERKKLAGEKVEEYFEKLVNGQTQFRQIPPTLSSELRSNGDYRIYPAGITRAIELIVAKKSRDSAAGGAAAPGAPGPGLQPAPGGPPTGNQPADTARRP